eukprot:CAMPEP_0176206154 /NCGR_PEP_ID=MMETSP0121_2-20121125/11961_1 /TAXON_ID=160619 /ORGANISM="Kryptoperidinium foliaceum, Strain CCMP 1326" /LENGTH=176 /DNA_ID=CAMNT_0017545105 /DNA_START=1 /DNA_END=532 /DNA_ORIENTATION=+
MSFNDEINVLKAGGFPVCACCCSECTFAGGENFALSAKFCCFSAGIGFKAAVAAAAATFGADQMGAGKAGKAAAAIAAAGIVDQFDPNECDVNFCDSCWDSDRGCCEVVCKVCCCYYELQCPPGTDIGMGACGIRCCAQDDEPPEQEYMQYGMGAKAALPLLRARVALDTPLQEGA